MMDLHEKRDKIFTLKKEMIDYIRHWIIPLVLLLCGIVLLISGHLWACALCFGGWAMAFLWEELGL